MGQHGRDRTGMAKTRGDRFRDVDVEEQSPEATTASEGGFAPQTGGQVGVRRPPVGTGPLVGGPDAHVVDEWRAGRSRGR